MFYVINNTEYGVTFVPIVEAPAFTLGDVNADGKIDIADTSEALTIYALLASNSDIPYEEDRLLAADYNQDGSIDIADCSEILHHYAETAAGRTDASDGNA